MLELGLVFFFLLGLGLGLGHLVRFVLEFGLGLRLILLG